jgi:hypothetical protein
LERDRTLKDFEVLQVCVFGIHIKLDSGHRDIEIDAVEDLAESGAGAHLLYLVDVQLKKLVNPLNEFLSVAETRLSGSHTSSQC